MSKRSKVLVPMLCLILVTLGSAPVWASVTIWTKGESILATIQSVLTTWSTPLCFIAFAIGGVTRMTAGDNPHKVSAGTNSMIGSLVVWILINGFSIILNTLQEFVA